MLKTNKYNASMARILSESSDNDKIEFLVYGRNLSQIQLCLEAQNCKTTLLNIINAVAGETTKKEFINLKFCKSVSKIEASAKVNCLINKTIETTNINALHKLGLTGKGITIALIDTGISPHFDLVFPHRSVKVFKNFINDRKEIHDDNGHGTFVAGTIKSSGLLSNGKFRGIAPNSELVILKALNSEGEASAVKILEAMQWIKLNAKKYNIKILCLSIGAEPELKNDPLAYAAEVLTKEGVCVVAAAGNSGPLQGTIKTPGISSAIITVGAVNDRDEDNKIKIAEFSSRGPYINTPKPDVVAPGVNIIGLNSTLKAPYIILSGTSMAAPVVAGFCALLLEHNKTLTPFQLKYIVKNSASQISHNVNEEGSGIIDASKLFIK